MKQVKRFLSVLLTLCMLMGMLPSTVFAVDHSMPFTDVENTDWFYDAVEYAYDNGIMSGTGDTTFSPDIATTRGMIVTILHRMEGTPSAAGANFTDVPRSQWYTSAVVWASANDIVAGYGNGEFGPNDPITREQMAAILYRYVQYKEYEHTITGDVSTFADFSQISTYAVEAMSWATGAELISGVGNNMLDPTGSATRAQVAMILMRFCEQVIPADTSEPETFTVTFEYNYGNKGVYETAEVNDGDTVARPDNPSRSGYSFSGWYTAATGGSRFDFDTEITQDTTLYAHWSANGGGGGSSGSTSEPTPTPVFYTVTFHSNGGSAVDSQSVESGKTAVQPAEPTREDWNFSGWYTDEACTQPYDFSKPVTGDLNLYAKWVVADNAQDPPSTEVGDDDVYNLSCDPSEVEVSSSATITFKVVSTLTVEYFELYCGEQSTGIKLYDDGGYAQSESADDIPADGTYTGIYNLTGDEEGVLSFTAKATVAEQEITTNSVTVQCYTELTDEHLESMKTVQVGIAAVMETAVSTLPEEATAAERTEARYNAVLQYLNEQSTQGIIQNVTGDKENGIISFVYTATGIEGVAVCSEYDVEDPKASIDSEKTRNSASDLAVDLGTYDMLNSIDTEFEYISYKERATILNYCSQTDSEQANRIQAYSSIAKTLEDAGFDVDNQFSVTVDQFKSLQDYQFIVTDCHGSYYNGTPVICTDQAVTATNAKTYSADLKNNRISIVTLTTGEVNYWIRPSFFTHYYLQKPLNCTIFYLNVCKGAVDQDKQLVNAILNAGADAVVAYSDTVYTYYGTAMLEDIVGSLLTGDTINTAVTEAQTENGVNDHVWGNNQGFEKLKDEIAMCGVYGKKDSILHASLENGNFDGTLDQQSDNINVWKQYGDARSIYKLAGLSPISSPKMAIISSGFGSLNDETTSAIYQTFLVPEDANTIQFAYNIVSEEPMEWVGTQYNDLFQAELLDTDGNNLSTLAFESVNTSTWYAIDGIDFPGGDDTTYHTRWITISSDEIAKYQGQLVVLRFMVQDAGDAIYDTAALIDSVVIH